jgi:hypothetical protein
LFRKQRPEPALAGKQAVYPFPTHTHFAVV